MEQISYLKEQFSYPEEQFSYFKNKNRLSLSHQHIATFNNKNGVGNKIKKT